MGIDIRLPGVPSIAAYNALKFYPVRKDLKQRKELIEKLLSKERLAVFHNLSLHKSRFYKDKRVGGNLVNTDRYTNYVVILPFFYELEKDPINVINSELYEVVKNI